MITSGHRAQSLANWRVIPTKKKQKKDRKKTMAEWEGCCRTAEINSHSHVMRAKWPG